MNNPWYEIISELCFKILKICEIKTLKKSGRNLWTNPPIATDLIANLSVKHNLSLVKRHQDSNNLNLPNMVNPKHGKVWFFRVLKLWIKLFSLSFNSLSIQPSLFIREYRKREAHKVCFGSTSVEQNWR